MSTTATNWTSSLPILRKKRARSASPNKSDEQEEKDGTNLHGRVVWLGSAATHTITIPSAEWARLPQLLEAVGEKIPDLQTVNTLADMPLSSQYVIALQEIGAKVDVSTSS